MCRLTACGKGVHEVLEVRDGAFRTGGDDFLLRLAAFAELVLVKIIRDLEAAQRAQIRGAIRAAPDGFDPRIG